MNAKTTSLSVAAVILAGVYVHYFTDWFTRPTIQIITEFRPVSPRNTQPPSFYPVAFGLDRKYEIKRVKVTPLKDLEKNKFAAPVWYLTTTSNSAPVRAFTYGKVIPGMKPYNPKVQAAALQPGVTYHLMVEANGKFGETNFVAKGPPIQTALREE